MRFFDLLLIAIVLASVAVGCDPSEPGPAPGPAPDPPPPPPQAGFDCAAAAAVSGFVEVEDPVPGHYIVVMKEPPAAAPVTAAAASSLARSYGATEVVSFDAAIKGFTCTMSAVQARQLSADPGVAFVQQEGRKRVAPLPAADTVVPWGLDRADQRDLPLDGRYEPGADGAGVDAYVIDTGIDLEHPAFRERIGEGFSAFPGSIQDDNGHGTHVAGTIGGAEFGIAPAVVLHPVKVLVNGMGTDGDVIRGVDWVTARVRQHGGLAVANMSLGGGASPALDLAVCNSIATGVVYAVAAGNDGADACDFSPARIVQALGVGASDRSDERASFSNSGSCVDLFAPGRDIVSARRGGGATTLSGTSMASPHVAGVAALCIERNSVADVDDVRRCVLDHATSGRLHGIGAGSPNLLIYAREV